MTKAIGRSKPPRTEVRGLMTPTFHVWFSPRRRKAALQGDIATAARDLLLAIARERGIEMLECQPTLDHVHLLMRLPPLMSVAQALQLLKGASARRLFQEFQGLKLDLGHDHFWQRGYGYRFVHPSAIPAIRKYIRRHERHELEPRTLVRGERSPSPKPRTLVRGDSETSPE